MDERHDTEPQGSVQKKKGWRRRLLVAAGCVLLALLFFFVGWTAHWYSLGENTRSLLWAIKTAKEHYYKDVDEDALYDEFFAAFELDPYSEYYTREQYAAILSASEGNNADTGISLSPYETNGKIRIYRIAGNSPAEHAGILGGMYIHGFGADEDSQQTGTRDDLLAFAQGHHGALVLKCGFDPEGADAAFYTVTSEEYFVAECLYRDSETAVRFLRNGTLYVPPIGPLEGLPEDTAYIRLDAFYGEASAEFERCLSYMVSHNKVNLIIDLRCNGGGYLSVFQEIATYLMREAGNGRQLAATARFKGGAQTKFYTTGSRFSEFFNLDSRIYILADENTASASECLIGAMVSYGTTPFAGIFVREQADGTVKTYGKGIMQSHYGDPYGNVLKLTSAEIFWPNGRSIHGVGVTDENGAIGIPANLLPAAEDSFLTQVLEKIKAYPYVS